jgi:glycerophosphoryl diester phosphodiesterase
MKVFLSCLLIMSTVVSESAEFPLIVGHRGASHDAPENTLAAFRLALEQGADAIEGDFRLTSDGHIVCIHDKDGRRTLGSPVVVSKTLLKDLQGLDAGSWKGSQWKDERVPTLEAVLDLLPQGKRLFLEVKCGPEIIEPIKKILESRSIAPTSVVVISFDAGVIRKFKKELPRFPACWITSYRKRDGKLDPDIDHVLATLADIGADGLDCQANEGLSGEFADRLRDAGHEFHVWTVNNPTTARRFMGLGVLSLTTDRPGWLREQLAKP